MYKASLSVAIFFSIFITSCKSQDDEIVHELAEMSTEISNERIERLGTQIYMMSLDWERAKEWNPRAFKVRDILKEFREHELKGSGNELSQLYLESVEEVRVAAGYGTITDESYNTYVKAAGTDDFEILESYLASLVANVHETFIESINSRRIHSSPSLICAALPPQTNSLFFIINKDSIDVQHSRIFIDSIFTKNQEVGLKSDRVDFRRDVGHILISDSIVNPILVKGRIQEFHFDEMREREIELSCNYD